MQRKEIQNLVGPQIRRLRYEKGWSQQQFMFKLIDAGLDVCRQRIARIEGCEACVGDFELIIIATILERNNLWELYPKLDLKRPFYLTLPKIVNGRLKWVMPPEQILSERSKHLLE